VIKIPFNRPHLFGKEILYMRQAVEAGHISGDGAFTHRCREFLEQRYGVPRVLLTASGTAALEMAALLCRIGPGDEVILPAFTFVSTANAFVLRGAKPVFVDIRPDTLNMDEACVDAAAGPKTRVIVPVHYGGTACEMDAVERIARRCGAAVVEDAAQAIEARYRDRPLGTLGRLGALSFHETKNVSCGEGGALFINDPALIERAEILREKGTNRSKFFRGEVDKYTWVDIGSSFLPSDLQAAFLLAQLENLDIAMDRRRRIYEIYREALAPLESAGSVKLPVIPGHCRSNYHLFYLLCETEKVRDALLAFLKTKGILAVFHYLPLHLSPMGRTFGGREHQCPVAESVSRRLIRLPFYNDLSPEDQDTVIRAVGDFFARSRPSP
jgi:dTDP-4-amino-4,6-dideoxygalactose transaminase